MHVIRETRAAGRARPELTAPINPPAHEGPRNGELPAYVSNGLVGLRVREMPLKAGMAIVSGVVGRHPERRTEAAMPLPYPLAGDIALDGVRLSDQPWSVTQLRQEYDFATGELTTRFDFIAGRTMAEVEITTFANRAAPALLQQEIAVSVNRPCEVRLQAIVDLSDVRGRNLRRHTGTPGEAEPVCDGSLLWEPEGAITRCGYALDTELIGARAEPEVFEWDENGPLVTTYAFHAAKGDRVRLRQIAALIPSLLHERPDEEAVRRVARGRETGFAALRGQNRHAWGELWKSRIVIHGAPERHQALVDAAFFYLNSSVHHASPSATSIFGLASWNDYHYYYGHVMWDIGDLKGADGRRAVAVEYLDFNADGTIRPVVQTDAGISAPR